MIDETASPRLIENGSEIIVFGLGGPVSISVVDPLDAAGSSTLKAIRLQPHAWENYGGECN